MRRQGETPRSEGRVERRDEQVRAAEGGGQDAPRDAVSERLERLEKSLETLQDLRELSEALSVKYNPFLSPDEEAFDDAFDAAGLLDRQLQPNAPKPRRLWERRGSSAPEEHEDRAAPRHRGARRSQRASGARPGDAAPRPAPGRMARRDEGETGSWAPDGLLSEPSLPSRRQVVGPRPPPPQELPEAGGEDEAPAQGGLGRDADGLDLVPEPFLRFPVVAAALQPAVVSFPAVAPASPSAVTPPSPSAAATPAGPAPPSAVPAAPAPATAQPPAVPAAPSDAADPPVAASMLARLGGLPHDLAPLASGPSVLPVVAGAIQASPTAASAGPSQDAPTAASAEASKATTPAQGGPATLGTGDDKVPKHAGTMAAALFASRPKDIGGPRESFLAMHWFRYLSQGTDPSIIFLYLDYYRYVGWVDEQAHGWLTRLAEGVAARRANAEWKDFGMDVQRLSANHLRNLRFLDKLLGTTLQHGEAQYLQQTVDVLLQEEGED